MTGPGRHPSARSGITGSPMEYRDYYATLGVPRDASQADIKKHFRRLARKHHPDVNTGVPEAESRFKELNEAYDVLSDPEKRKLYDQLGADWEPVPADRCRGRRPVRRITGEARAAGCVSNIGVTPRTCRGSATSSGRSSQERVGEQEPRPRSRTRRTTRPAAANPRSRTCSAAGAAPVRSTACASTTARGPDNRAGRPPCPVRKRAPK